VRALPPPKTAEKMDWRRTLLFCKDGAEEARVALNQSTASLSEKKEERQIRTISPADINLRIFQTKI
jgi:hypothetical protein